MITRPQDYQLVTPVGQIDGGILPARDVAGNGAAHGVRTEDLCFALEAVRERNFYKIADYLPNPSHVVRRTDWNSLWERLRVLCYGLRRITGYSSVLSIDGAEQFADIAYTPNPYASFGSIPLGTLYPNSVLQSCHVADITSPVMDNDTFWRRFYYDLKGSERLYVPGSENYGSDRGYLGTWSVTGTRTEGVYGNTYTNETNYNGALDGPIRQVVYQSNQRQLRGVNSGSTMTRVSLPLLDRVQSAVAVAEYKMRVKGGSSQYQDYDYYYSARCYPCSVSSAGVLVNGDIFLLGSDIVQEAEDLGYSLPATDSRAYPGYAEVRLLSTRIVALYNFRTEIRSLNWQWIP